MDDKGEVWMLDTFGNVHSLVNACEQLGFKVKRISNPSDLQSAQVRPSPYFKLTPLESSLLRCREFRTLHDGITE